MTLEQAMKEYLDGKFFAFDKDGKVKCRQVRADYMPSYNAHNYQADHGVNGGKISAAKRGPLVGVPKQRGLTWTDGQIDWLRNNYKKRSVRQCADALKIAYHRVYDKILKLRKEEKWAKR